MFPAHFGAAMGVGVDANHRAIVLVSDSIANLVEVFTETGTPLVTIGDKTAPGALNQARDAATDSAGNIYVADFKNERVAKFSPTGGYLSAWGKQRAMPGQFVDPYGISLDDANNVYVSDNNRMQEFTAAGTYEAKFGAPGTGTGQFFQPRRVPVGRASAPLVYAADLWGYKIVRFNNDTTYNSTIGGQQPPVGGCNTPHGLTMAPNGQMYVADTINQRVQQFDTATG